jgi:[ribosomal protein S5]-alanine N-acetyltransferase
MPRRARDVHQLTRRNAGDRRVRGLTRAAEVGDVVFLRTPRAADRDEFIALRRSSRGFLTRWEPHPEPGSGDADASAFDRLLRARRDPRHARFLVCARATGAIMGNIALNEIVRGPFQGCYLGYWIGRPFARRGFMTEAVALILRHAFVRLGLHRVEANIIPTNRPSLALIRRSGFRHEGVGLRYLCVAGRWQDHEHWAMTVEDWRRHRPVVSPARAALAPGPAVRLD